MEKANFIPNNEITYIPNQHVKKNPFLTREMETGTLPTYEGSRSLLPKPYWNGHDDTIACHDKAWQLAFSNLRMPVKESGFVSAFIDTHLLWHSYAVPATITTARTMAGDTTEVTMGIIMATTMEATTADNSPINHPAEALCNCGKFFLKKETVQRRETVV